MRHDVRRIRKGGTVQTEGVVLPRSGAPTTAYLDIAATSVRLRAGVVSRHILNDVPVADLYPLAVGGEQAIRATGIDVTEGHGCVLLVASPWEWIYVDDETIAVIACLAGWPHPDTLTERVSRGAGVEA